MTSRSWKIEAAPEAGMADAICCAGERDVYAELSINFQYGTRAGLKHAGGTPEGN